MKALISKTYGERVVFDKLELEIAEGETLCVLGRSGVGKTTLLNILARQTAFEGELIGVPERVGYAFQEPRLLPNLTVAENLRYVGGRDENIREILQKTVMYEHRNKRPKQLSGGEKQRISLARAFVVERELLLLDEPFSSLDIGLKRRLYNTFADLWQEKRPTVVLVTHDIEEAWALGGRIVVLAAGKIALDITPRERELPRAYTSGGEIKEQILQILTGGENGEGKNV